MSKEVTLAPLWSSVTPHWTVWCEDKSSDLLGFQRIARPTTSL